MKGKQDLSLLLVLAKKTGLFNTLNSSTLELARETGFSQQSVSRKLRELKSKGLISLSSSARGSEISITEKGVLEIKNEFDELKKFFSGKKTKILEGTVLKGLGEGKYYISRNQYLAQFRNLLGFRPFLGTLNIRVDENKLNDFLLNSEPFFISGFSTKERSFGSLKAFKIKIFGKITGAIIIPERTRHEKGIVEIISPVFLRKKFLLKEGSAVKISNDS